MEGLAHHKIFIIYLGTPMPDACATLCERLGNEPWSAGLVSTFPLTAGPSPQLRHRIPILVFGGDGPEMSLLVDAQAPP